VSPLTPLLARRIALQGPISIASYMAEALGHPQHGYYMRQDPFGRDGDFITAPEISQMFGELIGLWCVEMWRLMDQPAPFRLVELGPGRGSLMADALRAAQIRPEFLSAASVHLIETSPALRTLQQQRLENASTDIAWHDDLAQVPAGPIILIANEFFDALPIHQFERRPEGWRERVVSVADDGFTLALHPQLTPQAVLIPEALTRSAPAGAIAEICPAGIAIAAAIAERIADAGGAALIVDYGYCGHAAGNTLQAVRNHGSHDFLVDPGDADITAHVDFAALATAAGAAAIHGPITQGDFLRRLGIELRARQLAQRATAAQARDIDSACKRLIDPSEMGTLFKVLAINHPDMAVPPGFEQPVETA
jgi:NADH dehydrogenase [ubiquinone] 1 alpha subcomplex assembly factor 7